MKKIERQYTGGVVDESLSERCASLIRQLPGDTAALEEQIGVLLGRYRSWRQFHDTAPQVGVTIEHLRSVAKQAEQLRKSLELIPPDAEAELSLRVYKAWEMSFFDMERALVQGLTRMQVVATQVANGFEPYKGRPGGKRHSLQHELLSDVSELLEQHAEITLTLEQIAGLTVEILNTAGVRDLPITSKRTRDTINSWRKRSTPEIDPK